MPTEPLTQEAIFLELKKSAGIALPLFSLLALVTSVLGVGLGCVDFMEEAIAHFQGANDSIIKAENTTSTGYCVDVWAGTVGGGHDACS